MHRSRRSGRYGTTAIIAVAVSLLPGVIDRPASAACVQDVSTVTCSDDTPDGFVAGPGENDLVVVVEPTATVGNGTLDDTPAIGVNDGSTVTNEGALTASGSGAHGISAGDDAVIDNGTTTPGQNPGDADVVNPGSISVSGNGAAGIDAGRFATVRNDETSTIDVSGGDNAGIRVGSFATNVRNAGTITLNDSNSVGIELQDIGTGINAASGTIVVLGDDGVGMSGGVRSNLTNASGTVQGSISHGRIEVMGARGIAMEGNAREVTLRNTGTIVITGDDGIAFQTGAEGSVINNDQGGADPSMPPDEVVISGANGTAALVGDDSEVRNNRDALIDVQGAGGRGVVGSERITVRNNGTLEVGGTDGIAVLLETDSSIFNDTAATIEAQGVDGVALRLGEGGGDGHSIQNAGKILGGSDNGLAIDLRFSTDSDPADENAKNTLVNFGSGTIEALSGVAILGGASKEEIGNAGTIAGSIDLGAGADLLENVGTLTGNVLLGADDDTFRASFAGTHVGAMVDGGTGTDALVLGRDIDTEGSATFDLDTVSGFESLAFEAAGGVWAVVGSGSFVDGTNLTSGSVAVDGVVSLTTDYTQAAGTTLEVGIRPDGTSDRLDIDGQVTLESGAQLLVTASGGPTFDDTAYTVLTYLGRTDGTEFDISLASDSAFLSLSPSYGPTALEIQIARAPYISAAATPNQLSLANNLDEILVAGPTGDMAAVLAQIDMLSESDFQSAVNQLSPEIYDAQTSADLAVGATFADLLERRPLRCRESIHDTRDDVRMPAPCSPRGLVPWGAVIGDFGDRDGGGQNVNYNWSTFGGAVGIDARPVGSVLISGEIGGSRTWLGFGSLGGGDLSTLELGAAAAYLFERAHVRAVLEYGHGWHTTRRDIDFLMRSSEGRHQSDRIVLVGEAAYTFPVAYRYGTLGIEPIGTLDYAYVNEGAVRETGAESVSLEVDGRSNNLVSTSLGVRLSTEIFKYRFMGEYLEWADGVWRPEVDVRWRELWTGSDRAIDARFQGAPAGVGSFPIQAADARRGAQIGVGVSFQPWQWRGTIGAGYQALVGDGSVVQQAVVGVRVPLP